MNALLSSCFFFCTLTCVFAQGDSVFSIPAMHGTNQPVFITDKPGWLFKKGIDSSFSAGDLTRGIWQRRNPTQLTADDADSSGRVEGWFRLTLTLPTRFQLSAIAFRVGSWAAVDLYIDGRYVRSFGSTGTLGKPYAEYRYHDQFPVPISLVPGRRHQLLVHVVDYVSPLPPRQLKSESSMPPQPLHSEFGSSRLLFGLTGPEFSDHLAHELAIRHVTDTVWLSILAFLMLVFWVLTLLNPREKNLRLFAWYCTFATLSIYGTIQQFDFSNSFFTDKLIYAFRAVCRAMIVVMVLIISSQLFRKEISLALKILGIAIAVTAFIVSFYKNPFADAFTLIIFVGLSFYYLISSRKTRRNAQMPVVIGLLMTLFWIFCWVIDDIGLISVTFTTHIIFATGIYLTFPISLLVYVALRFQEMLAEIQEKAQKVVQVTEEKQAILANQNHILDQQVTERTAQLRESLVSLKATQAQLIQKEKMASLGELTAGIAHEIQNPLNFVNNFSELSIGISDELKEEIEKSKLPTTQQDFITELLGDLMINQQKISQHGKRASAIVKGMLEHSRPSSGEKRWTTINELISEYIKLAYHGFRAKNNQFSAIISTELAPDLPALELHVQDMGRVLMNLMNNALYAVEKKARETLSYVGNDDEAAVSDYQPTISVVSRQFDGQLWLTVADNGVGMSGAVQAKVFQPFFTTKPTGEGTGLGLSLAYDIVTQGHGGTLDVSSLDGEHTTFTISLPLPAHCQPEQPQPTH